SRKIEKADLALFYYAGHGLQITGKNYLVPIDAKLEREGDLSFEAIDVDVVLQQLEKWTTSKPRLSGRLPQQPSSAKPVALARYSVRGCWDGARLDPGRDRHHDRVCHTAKQRSIGWGRPEQSVHRGASSTSPRSRRRHQHLAQAS